MAADVNKVLDVARAEIGYKEKASPSQLDDPTANAGSGNYTKYARDLDALGFFYNGAKQGYAWCDVYVDWCFVTAYDVDTALDLLCQPKYSAGAGCQFSAQYYQERGQFHTEDPQPGDQIFFGTASNVYHTGIVESVETYKVHTIEGNSSDGVFRREYAINYGAIYGYGRPKYDSTIKAVQPTATATTTQPTVSATKKVSNVKVTISVRQLQNTHQGNDVKMLQTMLNAKGFNSGNADGEFGSNTDRAVREFQRASGLAQDGVCGRLTWQKILSQ